MFDYKIDLEDPPTTCPECGQEKGSKSWRLWAWHLRDCWVVDWWEVVEIIDHKVEDMDRTEAVDHVTLKWTGSRHDQKISFQDNKNISRHVPQEDQTPGHIETEHKGIKKDRSIMEAGGS